MSKSLYELFPPRTLDAQFDRTQTMYAPDGSTWDEYDERQERDTREAAFDELAQAVACQAEALAEGKIDASVRYAHLRRLQGNVETLLAWTDKP